MVNVLIVEDEAFVALDLQRILEKLGHSVVGINVSAEDALQTVALDPPDLILVDVSLAGDLTGVEMVQQIRTEHEMPVIYITAYSDEATIGLLKFTEPFEYILKPFNEQALKVTIELALHKAAVRKERLASERLLATTLQSIGDAVVTTDQLGNVRFLNPVAEALTGWTIEDAKNQPLDSVFSIINEQTREPAFDPVKAVLESGKGSKLANNTLLISRDGTEYPIEDSAAPIKDENGTIHGVVLVFRDVTTRRQSEMWLRQAQKLDSVGLLTGGIAHDFNNILGTITINTSALRRRELQSSQSVRIIERIQRASEQATALTQQLLNYAGGHSLTVEALDLNDIIHFALDLVSVNQPVNVVVEEDLCAGPLPILAERTQVQQILLNLILNAYDAMAPQETESDDMHGHDSENVGHNRPERNNQTGNTLYVRSHQKFIEQEALNRFLSKTALVAGKYVQLEIQDTGSGIEPVTLEKIFDPFFSTKSTGSGLGLAATLGIIYQCSGGIAVSSQVGVGTTFTIVFPLHNEFKSIEHRQMQAVSADERTAPQNSDEEIVQPDDKQSLVLLVDDQVDLLEALNDILTTEGYQTLLATDGTDAVELFERHASQIILVIIDIRMPKMDGTDALIAMYKHNADLKSILMTGYADKPHLASHQESLADVPILAKPFSYEEIVDLVQRVVDV